jgi:hypothetical protein
MRNVAVTGLTTVLGSKKREFRDHFHEKRDQLETICMSSSSWVLCEHGNVLKLQLPRFDSSNSGKILNEDFLLLSNNVQCRPDKSSGSTQDRMFF